MFYGFSNLLLVMISFLHLIILHKEHCEFGGESKRKLERVTDVLF